MTFLSIFTSLNKIKYRRMNPDQTAFYTGLAEDYKRRLNKIEKKIYRIGTLRLLCVILTGGSLYFLYPQGSAVLISIGLTGIILFCILCLFHNNCSIKRVTSNRPLPFATGNCNFFDTIFRESIPESLTETGSTITPTIWIYWGRNRCFPT